MNLWSLDQFLTIFVIIFGWVCCCTHPEVMTKMVKKCSTDQRFIRKRNTTYKIHTLVNYGNCKYFFKIMKKCWSHFRAGQQIQPGWSTFCLILCFWPSFYSQNGTSDQKYGSEIFVQKKRADNTKFDTNLTIQTVHRFEMLKNMTRT